MYTYSVRAPLIQSHIHIPHTQQISTSDITVEEVSVNDSQRPLFKLNDSSVVSEPPAEPKVPSSLTDQPDGLPTSHTSGELSTEYQRPLSIFSTGSSVSSFGSYQENLGEAAGLTLQASGLTLPRVRPKLEQERRNRALSVGSGVKRAVGINHFNRFVLQPVAHMCAPVYMYIHVHVLSSCVPCIHVYTLVRV